MDPAFQKNSKQNHGLYYLSYVQKFMPHGKLKHTFMHTYTYVDVLFQEWNDARS